MGHKSPGGRSQKAHSRVMMAAISQRSCDNSLAGLYATKSFRSSGQPVASVVTVSSCTGAVLIPPIRLDQVNRQLRCGTASQAWSCSRFIPTVPSSREPRSITSIGPHRSPLAVVRVARSPSTIAPRRASTTPRCTCSHRRRSPAWPLARSWCGIAMITGRAAEAAAFGPILAGGCATLSPQATGRSSRSVLAARSRRLVVCGLLSRARGELVECPSAAYLHYGLSI